MMGWVLGILGIQYQFSSWNWCKLAHVVDDNVIKVTEGLLQVCKLISIVFYSVQIFWNTIGKNNVKIRKLIIAQTSQNIKNKLMNELFQCLTTSIFKRYTL